MDINFTDATTNGFWDSNFFSGVTGALLGALVGGAISWALQSSAFAREARQKDQAALAANKLICMSLGFKTHHMFEQINMIGRHFAEELQKVPHGDTKHPFRYVQPIANVFDEIRFTTEELGLLLQKDFQLANDLALLQQVHNTRLAAVAQYNRIRISLLDVMQVHEVKGEIGTSILDGGEMARLLPRWLTLDSIIIQTMSAKDREFDEAKKALISVSAAIEKHFGTTFRVQFKESEVDETAEVSEGGNQTTSQTA